jgi:hypothetical protein
MRLSIATREAVDFACRNFHYSGSSPVVKYAFNVFNDFDEWCGVIIYGTGANAHIASPYGLWQGEVLELVRVALNGKQETTSQCVAASLKELRRIDPIVRMVVSYADIDQNHVGTIYQATNWIYEGVKNKNLKSAFIIHGKKTHPKSCYARGWKQSLPWLQEHVDPEADVFISRGKHKYLFAFDKKVRKRLLTLSKPYPKMN